jgi:hypothetical protein
MYFCYNIILQNFYYMFPPMKHHQNQLKNTIVMLWRPTVFITVVNQQCVLQDRVDIIESVGGSLMVRKIMFRDYILVTTQIKFVILYDSPNL